MSDKGLMLVVEPMIGKKKFNKGCLVQVLKPFWIAIEISRSILKPQLRRAKLEGSDVLNSKVHD